MRGNRFPQQIAENLHRLDLTKEQRDEHIRRYAELIEARQSLANQVRQNDATEIGYCKPPPQTRGVASQVAADTGLSVRTVQRALNPKPAPEVKSALEPESEHDAIIREANAIVSASTPASQEAPDLVLEPEVTNQ